MDPSESSNQTTSADPPKQRKRKSGWDTPAPIVEATPSSAAEQGTFDFISFNQNLIFLIFRFSETNSVAEGTVDFTATVISASCVT